MVEEKAEDEDDPLFPADGGGSGIPPGPGGPGGVAAAADDV